MGVALSKKALLTKHSAPLCHILLIVLGDFYLTSSYTLGIILAYEGSALTVSKKIKTIELSLFSLKVSKTTFLFDLQEI